MLVNKVIALAKASELRQLAVRNDDIAILGFINLGMLELYKRFPLKTEEAIITLQAEKTTYTLDGIDSDVSMEANVENFLLVSECYDEQGDVVAVNDENDALGILTPSYNTVQVPNVAQDEKLSIIKPIKELKPSIFRGFIVSNPFFVIILENEYEILENNIIELLNTVIPTKVNLSLLLIVNRIVAMSAMIAPLILLKSLGSFRRIMAIKIVNIGPEL